MLVKKTPQGRRESEPAQKLLDVHVCVCAELDERNIKMNKMGVLAPQGLLDSVLPLILLFKTP